MDKIIPEFLVRWHNQGYTLEQRYMTCTTLILNKQGKTSWILNITTSISVALIPMRQQNGIAITLEPKSLLNGHCRLLNQFNSSWTEIISWLYPEGQKERILSQDRLIPDTDWITLDLRLMTSRGYPLI